MSDAAVSTTSQQAMLGQILAKKYKIERSIARGGMAWIYQVRDLETDQIYALKLLFPHLADEPIVRSRFLSESRIQSRLQHPHIIRVVEGIQDGHHLGIIQEWINGPDLKQYLLEGKHLLSLGELRALLAPVLEALAHAHHSGIIHRDLKPGNIMLDQQGQILVPKLGDFGIAKSLEDADDKTATGSLIGTFKYTAPEQIKDSKTVDHRADIYAMGILMYQLAVGHVPFRGDLQQVLYKQLIEMPPHPCEVNPKIPQAFGEIIMRCLAKSPNERYSNCIEIKEEILNALPEGGTLLPTPIRLQRREQLRQQQTEHSEETVILSAADILSIANDLSESIAYAKEDLFGKETPPPAQPATPEKLAHAEASQHSSHSFAPKDAKAIRSPAPTNQSTEPPRPAAKAQSTEKKTEETGPFQSMSPRKTESALPPPSPEGADAISSPKDEEQPVALEEPTALLSRNPAEEQPPLSPQETPIPPTVETPKAKDTLLAEAFTPQAARRSPSLPFQSEHSTRTLPPLAQPAEPEKKTSPPPPSPPPPHNGHESAANLSPIKSPETNAHTQSQYDPSFRSTSSLRVIPPPPPPAAFSLSSTRLPALSALTIEDAEFDESAFLSASSSTPSPSREGFSASFPLVRKGTPHQPLPPLPPDTESSQTQQLNVLVPPSDFFFPPLQPSDAISSETSLIPPPTPMLPPSALTQPSMLSSFLSEEIPPPPQPDAFLPNPPMDTPTAYPEETPTPPRSSATLWIGASLALLLLFALVFFVSRSFLGGLPLQPKIKEEKKQITPEIKNALCQTNEIQPCYSGAPETRNKGRCKSGVQRCVDGQWSACEGEILPQKERCNEQDDDCDGKIDEDFPQKGQICYQKPDTCQKIGRWACESEGALACLPTKEKHPHVAVLPLHLSPPDTEFTVTHQKKSTAIQGKSCYPLSAWRGNLSIQAPHFMLCVLPLKKIKKLRKISLKMKKKSFLEESPDYCLP